MLLLIISHDKQYFDIYHLATITIYRMIDHDAFADDHDLSISFIAII